MWKNILSCYVVTFKRMLKKWKNIQKRLNNKSRATKGALQSIMKMRRETTRTCLQGEKKRVSKAARVQETRSKNKAER